MTNEQLKEISFSIADQYAVCWKCNGKRKDGLPCEKPDYTCVKWFYSYMGALAGLEAYQRLEPAVFTMFVEEKDGSHYVTLKTKTI